MKVHFTVRSRHREFVALHNVCVVILMGELEKLNNIYYGEVYYYISGFVKTGKYTSLLGVFTEDSWFCVMIECLFYWVKWKIRTTYTRIKCLPIILIQ